MDEWIDVPEIPNLKVKIEPHKPGFTVNRELSLKEFDKLREIVHNRINNLKDDMNHSCKKTKYEFEHLAPDHPWRRGTIPVFNG